ncbi:MAG: hypothetical protein ABSF37_04060 [Sedimentisphaerales bacterium]|jgi:hypothetical protein
MSHPNVFIIESLSLDNEKNGLHEGKILSNILNFRKKESIYYYIRTKKELLKIIHEFEKSDFRYLHFSCHGNRKSIATTFDSIPFDELSEMLGSSIDDKRLFFSACLAVNRQLALDILPNSKCISILGPCREVYFGDAAILWASFYHLMFKENSKYMSRTAIIRNAQNIANLFRVPLKYYYRSSIKEYRLKLKYIEPIEPNINEDDKKDQIV